LVTEFARLILLLLREDNSRVDLRATGRATNDAIAHLDEIGGVDAQMKSTIALHHFQLHLIVFNTLQSLHSTP
jgi:hypothetical protein